MRKLFEWAKEAEYIQTNPAADVNFLPAKTEGHPRWTMADVRRYEAYWAEGTRERVWMHVLLYTGFRLGDACVVGKQHLNDGWISMRAEKTGIEIEVCYTTLDGGEWYSQPGHLFYGQYEVFPDEIGFVTEEKADSNKVGKRCELVRYRINDLATITTPIGFSITNVMAVPREWLSPCQEFQQRLDTNPKVQAYGLKAKCDEASDGSISVALLDNDKSVAKDKAKKTLDDIAKGVVSGPWDFTITELTK